MEVTCPYCETDHDTHEVNKLTRITKEQDTAYFGDERLVTEEYGASEYLEELIIYSCKACNNLFYVIDKQTKIWYGGKKVDKQRERR